jgi:hypothetical protein
MKVFVNVYSQSDDGKISEFFKLEIKGNCEIKINKGS